MFLVLLDPNPDSLVRGMDPDPDLSIIKQVFVRKTMISTLPHPDPQGSGTCPHLFGYPDPSVVEP